MTAGYSDDAVELPIGLENEPAQVIDIESIRNRTRYNMPLTSAEQRWLVEQVSGKLPAREKRCRECSGTGQRQSMPCDVCNGLGMQALPDYCYRIIDLNDRLDTHGLLQK